MKKIIVLVLIIVFVLGITVEGSTLNKTDFQKDSLLSQVYEISLNSSLMQYNSLASLFLSSMTENAERKDKLTEMEIEAYTLMGQQLIQAAGYCVAYSSKNSLAYWKALLSSEKEDTYKTIKEVTVAAYEDNIANISDINTNINALIASALEDKKLSSDEVMDIFDVVTELTEIVKIANGDF